MRDTLPNYCLLIDVEFLNLGCLPANCGFAFPNGHAVYNARSDLETGDELAGFGGLVGVGGFEGLGLGLVVLLE